VISSNFVGESLDRLFGQALLLLILSSVIHCEIFACSLKKVFFASLIGKAFSMFWLIGASGLCCTLLD